LEGEEIKRGKMPRAGGVQIEGYCQTVKKIWFRGLGVRNREGVCLGTLKTNDSIWDATGTNKIYNCLPSNLIVPKRKDKIKKDNVQIGGKRGVGEWKLRVHWKENH